MTNNIKKILEKLDLADYSGSYKNQFFVVEIKDSDDYARVYTKLCDNAINTEEPSFGINTNNNAEKVTNYFELDFNEISYNLFLIANFKDDIYYLKIGEV